MIRIKTRTFAALAAALLASALFAAPLHAVGTDDPPPAAEKKPAPAAKPAAAKPADAKPAADSKPAPDAKPAAEEKKPAADDANKPKPKEGSLPARPNLAKAHDEFLREYRAARQLIVSGNYRAGIAAMHAIGQDEHPDVANYIGYAYRHLGDYDNSKVWYEAALKADPKHVRTWSYYGMWQMEQGNRLKALDHLQKVSAICGNLRCEEYRMLKDVIDGRASY